MASKFQLFVFAILLLVSHPLYAQPELYNCCETEYFNEDYRSVIQLAIPAGEQCKKAGQKEQAKRFFQMASMSAYFLGDSKLFRSAGRQARLLEAETTKDPILAELALANAAVLGNERRRALASVERLSQQIPPESPQRFRLGLLIVQSISKTQDVPDAVTLVQRELDLLTKTQDPMALRNAAMTALVLSEWLEHLIGDRIQARVLGAKALAIHRQHSLRAHPMASSDIESRVLAAGQEHREAIKAHLTQNTPAFRKSSRQQYARFAFLGYQHDLLGEADQALEFYQKAIQELETTWSTIKSMTDLENSADSGVPYSVPQPAAVVRRTAVLMNQAGHPDQAFELLERFKSRALLTLVSGAVGQAQSRAPQGLKDRYSSLLQELKTAEIKGKVDLPLTEKFHKAQSLLVEKDPRFESLTQVTFPKLKDLQAQLDPKTQVVSYHCGPKEILVCLVSRNSIRFETIQLSHPRLRLQVAKIARRLRRAQPALEARTKVVLSELHKTLVAPLDLPRGTDLVLIPSGPLHYLPFSALLDSQGRHLAQDHTLTRSPSVGVWLEAKRLMAQKKNQKNAAPQVFSLGKYRPNYGNYTPLPGTLREAQIVASVLEGEHHNAAALTKQKVLKSLEESDILHIATHGEFDIEAPLESQLILADAPLSAQEIFELQARPRLVVASACQTGLGVVRLGDEVVGLGRALLHAGVPSQVLSLWSIDDKRTADFMAVFYTSLKNGKNEAQALQAAQMEFLSNPDLPKHPYYWAPFFLNGANSQAS